MHSREFPGLIVGLGNPGPEYHRTPHNMGFLALDALFDASPGLWQSIRTPVPQSQVWRASMAGAQWLALKPQTYMNRSGDAVGSLARWYRIPPEHILVIHDELDLQPGSLRFKVGGGAAGHKGILSIAKALGTNDFPRLRLGIGRPLPGQDPAAYVLRNFDASTLETVAETLTTAVRAIAIFCEKGLTLGMQELHASQRKRPNTGPSRPPNPF